MQEQLSPLLYGNQMIQIVSFMSLHPGKHLHLKVSNMTEPQHMSIPEGDDNHWNQGASLAHDEPETEELLSDKDRNLLHYLK